MKEITLAFIFVFLRMQSMEDLFGIKEISYQNECHHYVHEYRMGNIIATQTTDLEGKILRHSGKILQENADNQILGPDTAQTTFAKIASLLETEKQFLAQKAERDRHILGVKG